ncbi:MAG: hypothetical protein ACTSUE_25505 [Promethearchaeota archaeon]
MPRADGGESGGKFKSFDLVTGAPFVSCKEESLSKIRGKTPCHPVQPCQYF